MGCSFVLSEEHSLNIVIHDEDHQRHQKHDACQMHIPFLLRGHPLSADRLYQEKYQSAPVQRRKGQQV